MDPLTPNDPLWKLMGQARPVVPRPNFTQNVLRAARQEPQDAGWWTQVTDWFTSWQQPLLNYATAAAVILVAGAVMIQNSSPSASALASVSSPPATALGDADMAMLAADDASLPFDSLEHMDALVAMEDTSTLTDNELQFLLY